MVLAEPGGEGGGPGPPKLGRAQPDFGFSRSPGQLLWKEAGCRKKGDTYFLLEKSQLLSTLLRHPFLVSSFIVWGCLTHPRRPTPT